MEVTCHQGNYFIHIIKHTYYVVLAWKEISETLIYANLITEEDFRKITELIIHHDESKITEEEFLPYARRFYPLDSSNKEENKQEFKKAVKIHKDRNLHHYETLKNYKGPYWKCYIIEMICDYIAMGWELNNYVFEYYESCKDKIDLPEEYKKYLELVLATLKQSKIGHFLEEPMTSKRETYLALV